MTPTYDFFSPESRANPYPLYHRLRSEYPIHFNEPLGAHVLMRYADISAALRNPRLSSRRVSVFFSRIPEQCHRAMESFGQSLSLWLLFQDAPDHSRLHSLVNQAFTLKSVEGMRPRIERIVGELLDAAQARGRMDAIRDLAYPLPTTVIGELLGVERAARDRLKTWSDDFAFFFGGDPRNPDLAERARRSWAEMTDYLRTIVTRRRVSPADDLISALIAAREREDALTEEELLAMCAMLLFAGHETTTNLIGNGLLALLHHPGSWERLREHPHLLPMAVEELLRYDSPVQSINRLCTEEFSIGDCRIGAGERVLLVLGAANRDPAQFPDPDRLDLGRTPNRHLAFGFGTHFCLGGPLARAEGQIAFRTLLERFSRLRLATDQVEWRESVSLRGLKTLPLMWD